MREGLIFVALLALLLATDRAAEAQKCPAVTSWRTRTVFRTRTVLRGCATSPRRPTTAKRRTTSALRRTSARSSAPPPTTAKLPATTRPPVPPPPAGIVSLQNIRYKGTALLPTFAAGASTGYAPGMLAVRLHPSSGSLFFYSDTHIYSNGAVYEFTVPSFSATAPYPAANVTNEFGIAALYGARRLDEALRPFGAGGCNVNGLHYDDVLGGLFWVYSEPYSTGNKGAPTLGFTPLSVSPSGPASGLGTPQGPWKVHPNIHWVRGGIASVPHGYAARMDPALRLAVGFGGTYSIVAGASWGPAMTLVNPANPGSSPRTVLGFDEAAGSRCPRPGDYWIADPGWLGTDPVNGTGTWTGSDVIGWETGAGSAVWTDAGALRGVLFWTSQGTGRIAYENGGIQQAGRTNRLYIFDPEDLVAAHGGASIRVRPRWYGDFPMPPGFAEGQFAGIARDPSDPAAFYAVQTGAAREGLEWHPVLHRFRIE